MQQHQHQQQQEDQLSAVQFTADSKAHWDRGSQSYAELWVRTSRSEPNCRQVIDAVASHCKTGVLQACAETNLHVSQSEPDSKLCSR